MSRVLARGVVLFAVIAAVLLLLEYVSITDLGYGYALAFAVTFVVAWTVLDAVRSGRGRPR